jgi:hypothetical protein
MRRCPEISTTLPGHIVSAKPGNLEVMVSRDLQAYLCQDSTVHCYPSKRSDVRFDWTLLHGVLEPCAVPEELEVTGSGGVPYSHTCSDNTVAQIASDRIVLRKPYVGPTVLRGQPRVLLRAALIPCDRTTNAYATAIASSRAVSRGVSGVYGSTTVPEQYTALCAHPTYPFLVAGTRSDKVVIVNPTYNHHLTAEGPQHNPAGPVSDGEASEVARHALPKTEEGGVEIATTPAPSDDVAKHGPVEPRQLAGSGEFEVFVIDDDSDAESSEQGDPPPNTAPTAVADEVYPLVESSPDSIIDLREDMDVFKELLPLAKRSRCDPVALEADMGDAVSKAVFAESQLPRQPNSGTGFVTGTRCSSGKLSMVVSSLASVGLTRGAGSAHFRKPVGNSSTKRSENSARFPTFRSASAATLPVKRNLLSTLARAKENVLTPAAVMPVPLAVGASSAKEVIVIDDCEENSPVLQTTASAAAAMSRFAIHGRGAAPASWHTWTRTPPPMKAAGSGGTIASFFSAVKK